MLGDKADARGPPAGADRDRAGSEGSAKVMSGAFSPDEQIVSGSFDRVRIWNVNTGDRAGF